MERNRRAVTAPAQRSAATTLPSPPVPTAVPAPSRWLTIAAPLSVPAAIASSPALRQRCAHILSYPGNLPSPPPLPPRPARFLFSVPMSVCLSVCLSCSLFWLRHFKAPRGSLGIIFFSSRNVSVPPHMHHMGCSQQPLHIRAQRRRRQPMVCPSLCTGSAPPARGDTGRAPSSHQAAPER